MSLDQSGIHPDAHALTLFRVLSNGEGRNYTATTFPRDPKRGCAWVVRMARTLGYVEPNDAHADSYAVLDALYQSCNKWGEIHIPVTSPKAFQWLKRRLDLRVDDPALDEKRE